MTPEEILASVQDEIKKSVINSTYTFNPSTRSIFNPENLESVIKILVPTTAPVRAILPRTQGFGQAAGWQKLTSRLDPAAGGTGAELGFADAGTPTNTTQTYSFVSAAYKNLGIDVTIGRQAIASNAGSNLEDVRAHEERVKMIEVMLSEENMILNGDLAASSVDFDGLAKTITTNSGTAALLTASGVGSLCQTLFTAGSEFPTHLVCSARESRALADDLQGTGSIQRIVVDDQGAAVGGVSLAKIVNPVTGNLINIVVSRYVGGYAYLLTVTSPSGENWIDMQDLESMSIYDVPNSTHAVQSRVYETTVLRVIGEPYQYKLSGLA